MSQYNIRFAENPDGSKKDVYFVEIPCKTVTGKDGRPVKQPQRPRVGKAKAMSYMYPHDGQGNQIFYILSNGKTKNDGALFANYEDAERECEKILEDLRQGEAGVKNKKVE